MPLSRRKRKPRPAAYTATAAGWSTVVDAKTLEYSQTGWTTFEPGPHAPLFSGLDWHAAVEWPATQAELGVLRAMALVLKDSTRTWSGYIPSDKQTITTAVWVARVCCATRNDHGPEARNRLHALLVAIATSADLPAHAAHACLAAGPPVPTNHVTGNFTLHGLLPASNVPGFSAQVVFGSGTGGAGGGAGGTLTMHATTVGVAVGGGAGTSGGSGAGAGCTVTMHGHATKR